MKQTSISVREIVEFVMRSGDIDSGFYSLERAKNGILAHKKLQEKYTPDFQSEVTFIHKQIIEDVEFNIEGRADGVSRSLGIVDEIKSTTRPLSEIEKDTFPLHFSQAKCYAYFLALEEDLSEVTVTLTYYQLETEEIKVLREVYKREELEEFFTDLLKKYLNFIGIILDHKELRDFSKDILKFPFDEYRSGQRRLAVAVYRNIENKRKIFIEAPTGIGKTMSTLFAAIKGFNKFHEKIYYLTGRSTGKLQAESAVDRLISNSLDVKSTVVTAKEKICINDNFKCNPRECKYAKGHFDRVNEAILDIYKNEKKFNQKIISEYAILHRVCPFELQMDLVNFSDIVVCDYNYVFDPTVYIRDLDSAVKKYTILVDEAHNLVDRGREMYSHELYLETFLNLSKNVPKKYRTATKHIKKSIEMMREFISKTSYSYYLKEKFISTLELLILQLNKILVDDKELPSYDEVLNSYFDIFRYLKISEFFDENFVEVRIKDSHIKIMCMNMNEIFKKRTFNSTGVTFFSATLTPMKYFGNLLGADENTDYMRLESPFPKENLLVLATDDISVTYRDRDFSVEDVRDALYDFSSVGGNFIFFFPSYSYMLKVYEIFVEKKEAILQEKDMTEKDREDFLKHFDGENVVAFCVLGGVFSEGIDLPGKKLSGVAVVTVGLPMISYERNIMKAHFLEAGFYYAYTVPGIVKISQAGGRVQRSMTDIGAVLLIDNRINLPMYSSILPKHWDVRTIGKNMIKYKVNEFFRKFNS